MAAFVAMFAFFVVVMVGLGVQFRGPDPPTPPWFLWPSVYLSVGSMVTGFALLIAGSIIGHLENRRIVRTGIAAEAWIVRMSDTGQIINEQPVLEFTLEVHPEDGEPFVAKARKLIPLSDLHKFAPDKVVNVRYDPESNRVALTDWPFPR